MYIASRIQTYGKVAYTNVVNSLISKENEKYLQPYF